MTTKLVRKAAILWSETLAGPCLECEAEVGCGPVGFRLKEPKGFLCDPCLAEYERGLGMALMAINVLREAATTEAETQRDRDARNIYLLTFATLYNDREELHWPIRPVEWKECIEEVDRQMGEAVGASSLLELLAGRETGTLN